MSYGPIENEVDPAAKEILEKKGYYKSLGRKLYDADTVLVAMKQYAQNRDQKIKDLEFLSDKNEFKEMYNKACQAAFDLATQLKEANEALAEERVVSKHFDLFKLNQIAAKVELILKPQYMNDVFTWVQIRNAILKEEI